MACLATKTAKVASRSNDHQKLIDLITFCEALDRLASVASICAHSHREGPGVFSRGPLISWAQRHIIKICRSFFSLVESRALREAMPQTLGRREKSFMVGFPAELSWLKGNEEVGRRDTGSRGVWGGVWGVHRGYESRGGLFFWSFLGQQKASGLCLSWQTHLACNCSDQTDNQSWKCVDKQKFTASIGKVNRSHRRAQHKQRIRWAAAWVWSVVCISIICRLLILLNWGPGFNGQAVIFPGESLNKSLRLWRTLAEQTSCSQICHFCVLQRVNKP